MCCAGKGYLKGGDAIKLLNAPSASFTATVTTTNGIDSLSAAGGTPALKFGRSRTPILRLRFFAPPHNYIYDTALSGRTVPYGTKGFITVRKGGDAAIYRVGQATDGWLDQWSCTFQNAVGYKTGDLLGTPTTGDPRPAHMLTPLDLFTINELGSFSG